LRFRNCLVRNENATGYELRIRQHHSSDWIENVMMNPSEAGKKILIADAYEIAEYNSKNPNQPLRILDERIIKINDWIVAASATNAFLFPIYQKAAMRLRENGLLDRVIAKWFDSKKIRPPSLESDPKVLTFDNVGVAFKIGGGLLILAVFIFMLERLLMYVKALIVEIKLAFDYLFEFTN